MLHHDHYNNGDSTGRILCDLRSFPLGSDVDVSPPTLLYLVSLYLLVGCDVDPAVFVLRRSSRIPVFRFVRHFTSQHLFN